MVGCCLVSFHFLWAILSTCTVYTNFDQKCHFKGIHLPSTLCPETENRWQPHCNGNSIHFLRSSCRSYSTKKRQRSFSAECNPIVCWRRQFNATMALIKSGENFTSLEFSCKWGTAPIGWCAAVGHSYFTVSPSKNATVTEWLKYVKNINWGLQNLVSSYLVGAVLELHCLPRSSHPNFPRTIKLVTVTPRFLHTKFLRVF